MSGITSITLNGVEIVTSDRDLVLSLIASPAPTAQPSAPAQSAAQPVDRVAKSAPVKPRKPSTRKPKAVQEKAPAKASVLAEIRRLYRDGDFDAARDLIPSGWAQVHTEVNNAFTRWSETNAALLDSVVLAPKVTKSKGKTTKSASTKSKSPKVKRSAKPKSVPTGTEGDAVVRVTPKEEQSLQDWKNLYTAKVNDLLAIGSADEIALGYAELQHLIESLDDEASKVEPDESGRLIAKACHLADLVGLLADFDGAMA